MVHLIRVVLLHMFTKGRRNKCTWYSSIQIRGSRNIPERRSAGAGGESEAASSTVVNKKLDRHTEFIQIKDLMHVLMQLFIGSLYNISDQNNYNHIVENVQLNVATENGSSSACSVFTWRRWKVMRIHANLLCRLNTLCQVSSWRYSMVH